MMEKHPQRDILRVDGMAGTFALFLIAKARTGLWTGRGSIDFLELGKPFLIGLVLAELVFLINRSHIRTTQAARNVFPDKYEMDVEELDKKREERLVTAKKLDNMVADKVENDMNETLSKSEKAEKNLDNTDYANEAGTEE